MFRISLKIYKNYIISPILTQLYLLSYEYTFLKFYFYLQKIKLLVTIFLIQFDGLN